MKLSKRELVEMQRNQLFCAAVRLLDEIQKLEDRTLVENDDGELVPDPEAEPILLDFIEHEVRQLAGAVGVVDREDPDRAFELRRALRP